MTAQQLASTSERHEAAPMSIDIGVCHVPTEPQRAGELALRAEEAGVGWFGVADSPVLYGAMYPAIQHALAVTASIRVGPLVTNPVTCHPSVHAATCAALATLHPGRVFFAIGAGDSAVHSAGLRPGRPSDVAATVDAVRERATDVPIITAVGGLKAASGVSAASDHVLLGTGLAPEPFRELAVAADAGPSDPRQRWVYAPAHLVSSDEEVENARMAIRSGVIAFSRHALAGDPVAKGAPLALGDELRELYAQYDFTDHGRPGSRNAQLLAHYPAAETYLFDRFAIVGTPILAARRLGAFIGEVGPIGVFLGLTVPDPHRHLALVGDLIDVLATPTSD